MSLYYDAATILENRSSDGGSFKSRVFNSKLKSSPGQVYALISEAAKWDILLKEVVENAGILPLEPKLTPLLSILLVHDFLLSKRGIAAPSNHPLRLAIERHKSRLKAEFVKSRVRRHCASVDELRSLIAKTKQAAENKGDGNVKITYPRWVRINNVRTTLVEQLQTTFLSFKPVNSLSELSTAGTQAYYRDPHIPDLLAIPQGAELISTAAYKNGRIILQDKASCFPAYLLLGNDTADWKGDLADGCAAPGNKTTHMASLICLGNPARNDLTILSMDASQSRSKILQKMVKVAGANELVSVLPGQDFLALAPNDKRFRNVTGFVLDPSCSGSGIVGRDDIPQLALPTSANPPRQNKKRKRPPPASITPVPEAPVDEAQKENDVDVDRLTKLSNLQSRIVEHALNFPSAVRVTYSTCSIHSQENESVVSRVLKSSVARRRGWRILARDKQPDGLRNWRHRGVKPEESESWSLSEIEREGCLRCWPNDEEGTGGFFVAGFVRDADFEAAADSAEGDSTEENTHTPSLLEEPEWEGFSSD
ncbi:hypothetical protein FQN52_001552 [Onygenales sp. PD_12]|nr:hypothetical protein FQN53_009216 [Emmonsiellopsis sp. PD_33]KAK2793415.1 hypothetical protein FQN52_001552 [Onygenales sp. PD_12]KAK2801347.1 hypothetical protein FQN51_005447 [Onygenales sp. PD_10]